MKIFQIPNRLLMTSLCTFICLQSQNTNHFVSSDPLALVVLSALSFSFLSTRLLSTCQIDFRQQEIFHSGLLRLRLIGRNIRIDYRFALNHNNISSADLLAF
jgi:hypothetical protein